MRPPEMNSKRLDRILNPVVITFLTLYVICISIGFFIFNEKYWNKQWIIYWLPMDYTDLFTFKLNGNFFDGLFVLTCQASIIACAIISSSSLSDRKVKIANRVGITLVVLWFVLSTLALVLSGFR